MTNTELIRQEIKRLQEEQLDENRHFKSTHREGIFDGLSLLDAFIDSLPKEELKINTEGDFARGYDCGYECCLNSHGAEWFEKQKEQKPAEWSEEDERIRLACIATINDVIDYERDRWEDYNPGKPYRPITKYDEQIDWLKSLRPQSHWKPSEMQMGSLRLAIDSAKKAHLNATADTLNEIYEQLKKL